MSHIVGIVLSTNYSQFIIDVFDAALIASMLVFFYFDRGIFFKKGRMVNPTLKGRGLVSPRPLVTKPAAFCSVHQGQVGR